MSRKIIAIVLAFVLLAGLFSCGTEPVQYEHTESNEIVYKTTDDGALGLDILYPTRRRHDKNPTVLVFHGGGWISGSRTEFYEEFAPLCDGLRAQGVTVVGVSYRFALDGRTWRDCLDDCEDALAYLLEHAAEYDIDTENMGVIGYSAGAHLALMTAIESEDSVKVCVSMAGPVSFTTTPESPYYSSALAYYYDYIFGGKPASAVMLDASPIALVSRKCGSSFLMVNGTADTVVSAVHAESFCREVTSFGLEAELILPEGLTHAYPAYDGFTELCGDIAAWVVERLG
ncbi:MAG: alpha/beta hydrolase [Clostridia bacterium]|nr:alpha/beta hydrolase [Clostridia bacterium]